MFRKVVSGGQTGVDRAALEWALGSRFECGGWCPSGRLAEDGPIDLCFPLIETPSEGYSQRTEWNVRDSDGTVVFSRKHELVGGTKLTKKFANKWNRPCLLLIENGTTSPGVKLRKFVEEHFIEILNVAGPRESTESGVGKFVIETLDEAFGPETTE